ncbi:MAG: hypothetical protein CL878_08385 [Dehalococcoidia bacterium]|nr:hypothetical protein [Dehalococcoidia bacterium]
MLATWRQRVQRPLHAPLSIKILVVNALLVATGIASGLWAATATDASRSLPTMLAVVGIGLVLCLAINGLILRAALWPLAVLERTARAVQQGDLGIRVPDLVIGDPDTNRLAATLNQMLDSLEAQTRQTEANAVELRRLSHRVLSAQEEERQRVALELHDETGQALTSVLVGLRLLRAAPDLSQVQEQAEKLTEQTRQTLDNVRHLALGLYPQTLSDLGLIATVRWYVKEWSSTMPISASFRVTNTAQQVRLTPPLDLALYRVIQEALTNTVRHSGANTVQVQLDRQGQTMMARIEDDGLGFDPATIATNGQSGLGLVSMRERLALVRGQLTITSAPGRGTRLLARVHLDPHTETSPGPAAAP